MSTTYSQMIVHHPNGGRGGEVVSIERDKANVTMFTTGETGQWAQRCSIYQPCNYVAV